MFRGYSNHDLIGCELGKGRSIDETTNEMFMAAEGVKSTPAVIELARRCEVSTPIANEVYSVVTGKIPAARAFRRVLKTAPTAESEPR